MPFVRLSERMKEKLEDIKKSEQHTSIDSVIRSLVLLWERSTEGEETRTEEMKV